MNKQTRAKDAHTSVAKSVYFLVSGGGFQWESLALSRQLPQSWQVTYIRPQDSVVPDELAGRRLIPIPSIRSRANSKWLTTATNLLQGIRILRREMKRDRPDVAICLSSNLSLPVAIACRLCGIRCIFVESITRVDGISWTGRLLAVMRLIGVIYVQWPEQAAQHSKAVYKGTVL